MRDLLALLFKARPVLRQPRTPSQEVRHRILTSVLESPEYRRLRATTRLQALPAAEAAAEVFAKLLADWPAELDSGTTPCASLATNGTGQGTTPSSGPTPATDRLDTLVRQLLRAEAPLGKAMDLVLTTRFKRADVVFLTDGECQLSSPALAEVLATKAKRQVRIFSVLIDLPDGSSCSPSDRTLRKFSDEVCRLTELAQDAVVLGRLFGRS